MKYKDYTSVKEAEVILGFSPNSIKAMIHQGQWIASYFTRLGNFWYISRENLIKAKKYKPKTKKPRGIRQS